MGIRASRVGCLPCHMRMLTTACQDLALHVGEIMNQDPPCGLNWGCMVSNSRYLGPNRG